MTVGIVPGPLAGTRIVNGQGVPLPEFGRWLDFMRRFGSDANSGHLAGTATGDNPNSGDVGELQAVSQTPLALTSGAALTICTLPIPPGDWVLYGASTVMPAATTSITLCQSCISTATNTLQGGANRRNDLVWPAFVPAVNFGQRAGPLEMKVPAGAPVNMFWVVSATFTVSTLQTNGILQAFRIR